MARKMISMMISVIMVLTMMMPQLAAPVDAAAPQVTFEKAHVIDAEGNLQEAPDDLDASFSKTLPATAANIAGGSSSLQVKKWDRGKYDFVGFQMNGKMLEPGEMMPGKTVNGEQTPKQEILEGITTSTGNLYVQQSSSFTSWIYALYSSGPTAVTEDLSVYPVFKAREESENTFSVEADEGGTVTSEIINGKKDAYYIKAAPNAGYVFDNWLMKKDGSEEWEETELEVSDIVELDASTSYKATFTPLALDSLDVTEYSMSKSSEEWTMLIKTALDQPGVSNTPVKYSVYDSEGEPLLENYSSSISSGKSEGTPTLTMQHKPAETEGTVKIVAKLDNGSEIEREYKLSGTLSFDQEPITIDWTKAIFLEMDGYDKEVDLSVSGEPEPERVKFSTTSTYAEVSEDGHVVFGGRPFSTQYINIKAVASDGRTATLRCTMNLSNGIKIAEDEIVQKEKTEEEYGYLSSANQVTAVSVSGWKLKAESSDEDIFTAEVTQYNKTSYPRCADHIQGIKINAKKSGTGYVTLTTGSTGNYHVVPVTITSDDIGVEDVYVDNESIEVQTEENATVKAQADPVEAAVSYSWESEDPGIASVKDGVITGHKPGKTTIIVKATDSQGYTVKAFCDVTVKDDPYKVNVFLPKNVADDIHFYPTTGFDEAFCDEYDEANEIEPQDIDTESNDKYDIYSMPLMKGTYSYRAEADGSSLGGGAFQVPTDFDNGSTTSAGEVYGRSSVNVYLKEAEYYALNEIEKKLVSPDKYTVKAQSKVSTLTMGDVYENEKGISCYHTLIVAGGNALLYDEVFAPVPEFGAANSLGSATRNNHDIAMNTNKEVITATLPTTSVFTVNAPEGSAAFLYHQSKNYNTKKIEPVSIEQKDDGTADFKFNVSPNSNTSYRVMKEGEKTQAGYLSNNMTSVKVEFDGTPSDPDDSGTGMKEAGMVMNINERNNLELSVGEVFKVRAYRAAWQIVNNVTSNIMIEPDFHYNILSGDDVIDLKTVDGGNAKDNWANVKAKKEGVAIVEVSYDAIGISNGTAKTDYGATDPNRKSVFVVTVGSTNGNVEGIDWDTELNTAYFTGDEGVWHIDPEAKDVKVEVASVSGGALSDFEEVEETEGFDVPVVSGNNVIRLTSGNIIDYIVVRGSKVDAVITNKNGREDFKPGDSVEVRLKNTYQPYPKMSSIYNPGFGGTMKYQYKLGDTLVSSKGVQYNLTDQSFTFNIPETAEGEIVLTEGEIIGTSMGDHFGAHRTLTDIGAAANFNAVTVPIDGIYLPDLVIPVTSDIEDIDREAAIKEINDKYDALIEVNEYKAEDKEALGKARDAGIEAVNQAAAKKNMEDAVDEAIEAMEAIAPTTADAEKDALGKTIDKAEKLYGSIEEGTDPEEYQEGTLDALDGAIAEAEEVYYDPDATIDEIAKANEDLKQAIEDAKAKQNEKILEQAKKDAIKELEDFAAERAGKADQDKLDIETLKGKDAIRDAETLDDVETALSDAKEAIKDAILNEKLEKQQALEEAQNEANEILDSFDPEVFRDEAREGEEKTDREMAQELVDNARDAVKKAKSADEVAAIMEEMMDQVTSIPTADALDEQELEEAKEKAAEEIDKHLQDNMDKILDADKAKAELDAIKAKMDVMNADSIEDVNRIAEDAKAKTDDAVKKAADEKKAAEEAAKNKAKEDADKKAAEEAAKKVAEEAQKKIQEGLDKVAETVSDVAKKTETISEKLDDSLNVQVNSIKTGAKFKNKTMKIKWKKVADATNYKIAYRQAGKKWTEKSTGGKNTYTLKNLKRNGLYEFKLKAEKVSGTIKSVSEWSKVNYRFFANTRQKLTAGKKAVTAKLKKVKKASGYDVGYSLKKDMKGQKLKTAKGAKKTKVKISKLKSKKNYFVKSRPYKNYKGHKYIGIWNGAKKVKTK